MYRSAEVIEKLFGRVGFKNSTQVGYTGLIDSANEASKSGRFFNGFHALVTVPNLKDVCNIDKDISDSDFNKYLKDLQTDAILSVLDGIFSESDFIEQNIEFDRTDNRLIPILNAHRFVGRRIRVASDPTRSVKINSISLSFNGVVTFPLYLFDNVKKAPLWSQDVTTGADNQVVITPEDDLILNYLTEASKSGLYWLGYFQDDLGGVQAYDEYPYCYNNGKCYGSDFVECLPAPGNDIVRFNPYITSRTNGLNVEFSSFVDFTEMITRNPGLFDKAIGLQLAAKVVEQIIHSTRSNDNQRVGETGSATIYAELNQDIATQDQPYSSGLRNQLKQELKRLKCNFFPKQKAVSTTIGKECYTPRFRR